MPNVLRILDANANRAREALRVMEEAARFLLDHTDLSTAFKSLRHDLASALATVDGLEANRDTCGDVGTEIRTETEAHRTSVADVVIAAGKRLGEALRSIEEYGKTLGPQTLAPDFSEKIEKLRYRGYELEQRLDRALATGRRQQWRLCVLLTESLCAPRAWMEVLKTAIGAGADCIQLREKQLDSGLLLERAGNVVEHCHRQGVSVIINDRPDVALASGADGVHVGQSDLPPTAIRKIVGHQLLIGVSTSNLDMARRALADGADYCGVGPMFPSTTKHKSMIVGPEYLQQYVGWGRLPHLAIGGITPDNIATLTAIGGRGVAVSSCVCAAYDPDRVVRKLLAELGAAKAE